MNKNELTVIANSLKDKLTFSFPYDIEKWVNEMDMMMENYHKHTSWSDLVQMDSATSIEEFFRKLDEYGCKCYFSGEHGFQGEWLYCYDLCQQTLNKKFREDIKINNSLKFRYSTEMYWVKDASQKDMTNCHIVIVARNYVGSRKLNYLISKAHEEQFYGKPRIDLDDLFSLSPNDVYITSACIAGWKYEDAQSIWLKIWGHFKDSFFLEYQCHNTPEQKEINRLISRLSSFYGIQTIVGLDTHYLSEEDSIKRDNLLKRKGMNYPEEDGWYMDFPNGNEVYERMKKQDVLCDEDILISMMNTHVFIDGCEEIKISTDFKIPILDKYKKYNYEQRCKILKRILDLKFQLEPEDCKTNERRSGIEYEFNEIKESGTVDYFLDDYNIVKLATSPEYGGQLTTTSRGSSSSYYSNKLLGFTTIDRFESEVPIIPERFITKERILSSHQCPDIDMNCSSQEPFFKASRDLLGRYSCYPLLAVGKLGEKSGFKLYADIKGVNPSIANEISVCIDKYNEALKQADDEEDKKNIVIEDYIEDEHLLEVFNDSKDYQGIVEQAKCHACGFLLFNGDNNNTDIIGYGDIRYEIGLLRCHSESTGKTVITACVEGNLLDTYGYVKNDYLIVDVVGIINKLYKSIGMEVPTVNELRKMTSGDKETWRMYEIGATCCLNQCEKPATTKRVMKYKPQNSKELSAFIAGIRPGFKSLLNGFLDRIKYSSGEEEIDEILKDSFHYMLYQEAVMNIFSFLGIDMKDSYDTIKKISKKKLQGEALKHVEDTLKEHWEKNIGNLDNFEAIYKVIKDSARYSFNAPHALSMNFDSLYEAWMKAHHRSKFYEIVLNHYQDKEDKNKVADIVKEATTIFGYSMGEYEYGKDNSKFTVDDESKVIYPNLASVKGIGVQTVQQMMDFSKTEMTFSELYLSIKGTKVDNTTFKKLISINYFRRFGSIKKLLAMVKTISSVRTSSNDLRKKLSTEFIESFPYDISEYITNKTAKGAIAKQYTVLDHIAMFNHIFYYIPEEEYSSTILASFQSKVLGYTSIVDDSISNRYIVINNLDTTYSPRFSGYFIKDGKSKEFKVHKQIPKYDKYCIVSFNEIAFEDGDILYIKDYKKQYKKTKNNTTGKWEEDTSIIEFWIKDYIKVDVEGL